jgi:hypothetical protein
MKSIAFLDLFIFRDMLVCQGFSPHCMEGGEGQVDVPPGCKFVSRTLGGVKTVYG